MSLIAAVKLCYTNPKKVSIKEASVFVNFF